MPDAENTCKKTREQLGRVDRVDRSVKMLDCAGLRTKNCPAQCDMPD